MVPGELPGLDAGPVLPRDSSVEREPCWPDRPDSREPGAVVLLFRLSAPRFSKLRELPFTGETPFCRIALEICACSRVKERPEVAVVVPCVEKKR
jgi:hypothetical protein